MRPSDDRARDLRYLGNPPAGNDNNSPYFGTQRRQRSNLIRVAIDLVLLVALAYMALKVSGQSARIEQLEREMGPNVIDRFDWKDD